MASVARFVWPALMLATGGCLPIVHDPLKTVKPGEYKMPKNFKSPGPAPSPATQQEMLRVQDVGQKLIRSNRESGLRPSILTIGVKSPELFHKGTDVIYVTEGLSTRCVNEGQLAAVLAFELGRMVAERESLAGPETRRPERLPPQESRVGTDSGGPFGPADGTRLVELARYEKERGPIKAPPPAPPDPMVLARGYLEKAGYSAKDLDSVAPLLREARGSDAYERQMVGGQMNRPWTP